VRVIKTYWRDSVTPHVINLCIRMVEGTRWRSWLRHCATSRKVAVPIPDVVFRIFDVIRPHSGRGLD